jgi:hypothetical protein
MSLQPDPVDYPELLRALGHFVQEQHLAEVVLTEFDRGWIIAGLTFKSTAQGFLRVPVDFVISHDELRTLITSLREKRKDEQPRRRWMR